MIVLFFGLLSYFFYNLASQTGLIPNSNNNKSYEKNDIEILDTNQIKLAQKDSIIKLKDQEIHILKEELSKRPDTVYLRPKSPPVYKNSDTISPSVSKVDSIN